MRATTSATAGRSISNRGLEPIPGLTSMPPSAMRNTATSATPRSASSPAAMTSTTLFAVRGTVSTGFRAPTLAEGYYSGINVRPRPAFSGQLRSELARRATLLGSNWPEPGRIDQLQHRLRRAPRRRTCRSRSMPTRSRSTTASSARAASRRLVEHQPKRHQTPCGGQAIAANGVQIDPRSSRTPPGASVRRCSSTASTPSTRGADLVIDLRIRLRRLGLGRLDARGQLHRDSTSPVSRRLQRAACRRTGLSLRCSAPRRAYNLRKLLADLPLHRGRAGSSASTTVSLTETLNGPVRSELPSRRGPRPSTQTELDTTSRDRSRDRL